MANENSGRFFTNAESMKAITDLMPPWLQQEYYSYGALTKEAAFPNRRLVVYTVEGGKPCDIEGLFLGGLNMSEELGPTAEVHDSLGGQTIGMVPKRWRDRDLFLQIPQHFDFRWLAKQSASNHIEFAPHYALLIKTRSKELHQVNQHTYCATLNNFRERFPEYPIRY